MRAMIVGLGAALLITTAVAQQPGAGPGPGVPGLPPGGGGAGPGAPPAEKDKKLNLEDLLGKALQHSPEVQVAEAKLKEAEAQLRQTRLEVARKLVDLHTSMDQQQKTLALAESEFKRMMQMRGAGTVSTTEANETERKLLAVKAQVTQLESQVNALTGRLPLLANFQGLGGPAMGGLGMGMGGGIGLGGAAPADDGLPKPRVPRGPAAEKLLAALNKPFKLDKEFTETQLSDVFDFVRDRSGTQMLINLGDKREAQVAIRYQGETTLGGILQILCDVVPDLRIGVRDYGFLVTINGNQPDDMISVIDFWHSQNEKAVLLPPKQ